MKILIGADFMPGVMTPEKIESIRIELMNGEIRKLFEGFDYRILNLETPITRSSNTIIKCGKNQKTSKESVIVLKDLHVDLLALANNHILDYGSEGLMDTIQVLDVEEIAHLGAGHNLEEAKKPFIISSIGTERIGIYNCCEHEYSIGTESTPGANPYDPLTVYDDVRTLKQECDHVIVLYHGGKEYYPFPTPELQRVCRKFIDSGADLVIVQHTHCIGCEEKYKDRHIVYGQGNFYSMGSSLKIQHESVLISVDTSSMEIDYWPIFTDENHLYRLEGIDGENVLSAFWSRSDQIKDEIFVQDNFHKLVLEEEEYYKRQFVLNSSIFERIVNKLTFGKYTSRKCKQFFSHLKTLSVNNIIECEAHRELLIQILKNTIYGEK